MIRLGLAQEVSSSASRAAAFRDRLHLIVGSTGAMEESLPLSGWMDGVAGGPSGWRGARSRLRSCGMGREQNFLGSTGSSISINY